LCWQESSNNEIHVLVRDDGSNDHTIKILRKYKKIMRLNYYIGENIGPCKSFIDLIDKALLEYDYYFFCDQDDVWKKNKVFSALNCLLKYSPTIPSLYYCALDVVDSKLKKIGSYYRKEKYFSSIKSTLITGPLVPGCTICFNNSLMRKVKTHLPNNVGMHDNWLVLVCLFFDGRVVGDQTELILYRQHDNNVVGAKKANAFKRIRRFFSKRNTYSDNYKELLKFPLSSKNHNYEIVNVFANYKNNRKFKSELLNLKTPELNIKEKFLFKLKVLFNVF